MTQESFCPMRLSHSLCSHWNIYHKASYYYRQWKFCLWRSKTFNSDTHSFISITLFEFLFHLLSLHSTPISDPDHIMTLLFKILSSEVRNQIIFHVLSSVNNSYNSLNTNCDGHFTYTILLIFPPSVRWVLPHCFASKMQFF